MLKQSRAALILELASHQIKTDQKYKTASLIELSDKWGEKSSHAFIGKLEISDKSTHAFTDELETRLNDKSAHTFTDKIDR